MCGSRTTLSRTTLEALPTTGRISQLVNFIPGAVVGNPVWQKRRRARRARECTFGAWRTV